MTTDASRPNFFIILGLDPAVPWNDAVYQRTLSEKRNEWSRQSQGVKTSPVTVEAKRNLALVRTIESDMRDPAIREQHRQAALRIAADGLGRKRDKFAADLDLMLEKGFLWDVEHEKLRGEQAVLDASPELRRRVERAEKRPRQQVKKDSGRLAAPTERNIRTNLAIVGKPDLYAVLRTAVPGVSERTPRQELLAAAQELYQKAQRNPNKTLPEVGAKQQLAGIAQQVFGTDDLRQRHDMSMRMFPLDDILSTYEQTLAAIRAIDSRQSERFLREAAEKGIDIDVARDAFTAYFREKNWSVDMPSATAEARLRTEVRCPHCGHLNDQENVYCAQCSRALRDSCPACDALLPVAARACPRCGFPVAERAYAEYLAEEAEACVEGGDLDGAASLITRWESVWPMPEGRSDALSDRVGRVRARVSALRAALEEKVGQATVLMGERRYHDALRQLRGLPYIPPSVSALVARCEEAVRESDRLCREARTPGVPDERRALLYSEALRLCADNSDARDGLALIPPPPPRRLRAEVDSVRKVVRLTWESASGLGYSSVIFRADGPLPPESPRGQARRAVARGRGEWEDTAPLVGLPMWYAVYTERDAATAMSQRGAITSQAVLLTADPEFTARPGEGQVGLAWTLPENAAGIEISRVELGPGGAVVPETTVVLPPPGTGTRFLADTNVRNGTTYRYVASATFGFRGQDGRYVERRSAGTTRVATPIPRPELPGAVQARGNPPPPGVGLYRHKVELRWRQAQDGVVKVIRTVPGGVGIPAGDDFPESALHSSQLVLEPDPGSDIWFTELSLCSYTPVLFLNGRCYAGEARHYVIGPEVADLRAEADGSSVRVTWTWPDEIDAAVVAWGVGAEPFDPVAAPSRVRVPRSAGQRGGWFDVPAEDPQRPIVRVAAVRRRDGLDYITSGITTSATASIQVPAEQLVQTEAKETGHEEANGPRPGSRRGPLWTRGGRRGQRP